MTASDALELAETIIDLIDDEVPDWATDKAPEFFEGVRERAASIAATIEKTRKVSAKQADALGNMESAVRKWIK